MKTTACMVLTAAFAAILLPGCATQPAAQTAKLATPVNKADTVMLHEKWGIEITSLRLSARGRMIDFRYKVLDPDKAATLAKRENKPKLTDQATGAILLVPNTPKLGPLRQSAALLIKDKIYFVLFGNTRCIVKSGNKVTVTIGEFKVENLTVE